MQLERESRLFPAPRRSFLEQWIGAPGTAAVGSEAGGRLAGYGVIRPCRKGAKVGPLFAASPAAASRLLDALLQRAGPGPVYLDVPEPNAGGIALARRFGLEPCFETIRMYRGEAPEIDLAKIFGITTFELG
jgi:hypothetical protein